MASEQNLPLKYIASRSAHPIQSRSWIGNIKQLALRDYLHLHNYRHLGNQSDFLHVKTESVSDPSQTNTQSFLAELTADSH